MDKYLIVLFIAVWGDCAFAQKEDHNWLLGGSISSVDSSYYKACRLDFEGEELDIHFIHKNLPFIRTNAVLSDSAGELLCYSNGENLYNRNFEVMENGDNFYPNSDYVQGFPAIQGFMLLPLPGSAKKVVHIYGDIKTLILPDENNLGYIRLKYAIADLGQNNGLGKVIQRDDIAGIDTLIVGQLTATRHGNGRDWWVMAPHFRDEKFYRFLLTPNGLAKYGEQHIGAHDYGLGQTVFSPDGQWYARYVWHGIGPDSSFFSFDLYHFDRCSGLFSDRVCKTYDLSGLGGKPGGVAFSPSSRFLYVSRWDSIYQYDLQAPNIIDSEVPVAGYDGFIADYGRPTRFYSLQLAPDEKIYCCVSNYNSRYLHTIENPNEPGLACNVQQHSVHLPVFNNFLLPNMPFYRLWGWEGSPCDTLGSVSVKEVHGGATGFSVYPNPTSDAVNIVLEQAAITGCRIELFSMTSQLIGCLNMPEGTLTTTLPLNSYPNGYYFLRVIGPGQRISSQKITIMR